MQDKPITAYPEFQHMKYSEATRAVRQARQKIEVQLTDEEVKRAMIEAGHSPEISAALVKHAHLDLLNDKVSSSKIRVIVLAVASIFSVAILPLFAADTFNSSLATRGYFYLAAIPVVTLGMLLRHYALVNDRKQLRNTL